MNADTIENSKAFPSRNSLSSGSAFTSGSGMPSSFQRKDTMFVHGYSRRGKRTKTHSIWLTMKSRCYNPKVAAYKYYGARGITVCDRWRLSFLNFLNDMGEKPPGKSLERIDNNRGYEPGNVRWAVTSEQNANRRNSIMVTVDGVTECLAHTARRLGLNLPRVKGRLKRGWSMEDALMLPKTNSGWTEDKGTIERNDLGQFKTLHRNQPKQLCLNALTTKH